MGTSVPLSKLMRGGWFRSLFPSPVAWLRWTTVGWIVGSVRFSVSVLNGSAISINYFTDLPISVVGKNIWSGCSVLVIHFLVILFPSGVIIGFFLIVDCCGKLIIIFSHFFQFFSRVFLFLCLLFFNTFICLIFVVRNLTISLMILRISFCFSFGIKLYLLLLM